MPRAKRAIGAKGEEMVRIDCPGCEHRHVLPVAKTQSPPCWAFNGDYDKPTLSPSILCRYYDWEEKLDSVCHSFVRDGQIQFLSDCTHHLKGQTVPLPEINDASD